MLAKYLAKEERVIRKNILFMANETIEAVKKAIQSYKHVDISLAEEIIAHDPVINNLEKEVEANCIQLIARQQPVAHDLRELLADMHISKELERIADYAVTIAKIVQKTSSTMNNSETEILYMAEKAIAMLEDVMIDYAEEDAKKANAIALKDDEIDELEHDLNDRIFKLIETNPENAINYTYQLWIIHHIERVGDRVTNIAESVIFQATGKLVNLD